MSGAVGDFVAEGLEEDSFSASGLLIGVLGIDDCAEVVVHGDAWADLVPDFAHCFDAFDNSVELVLPVIEVFDGGVEFACLIYGLEGVVIPVAGVIQVVTFWWRRWRPP